MRVLELRPGKKFKGHGMAVQEHDFVFVSKGTIPGEWLAVFQEGRFVGHAILNLTAQHLGYFLKTSQDQRPLSAAFPEVSAVTFAGPAQAQAIREESWVKDYLRAKLAAALERRQRFGNFTSGRLCYGIEDDLPGLVIDLYQNCVIYQINLAGIDRFREVIHTWLEQTLAPREIFNLENPLYRQQEGLCAYQDHPVTGEIKFTENGLHYAIKADVMQKIGHYFDHARNRQRAEEILAQLQPRLKFQKGLDLFCYAGSWGLHLLRAGVGQVDFIDQGNFGATIAQHLALNGFAGRGHFQREDVFKFLGQSKDQYDVVVCDPPAFRKGQSTSPKIGYEKLYRLILPHLA
ncbi:MAG: class I SAM-dependent methyltransferase, partial [Bacteriovoracaceae bacterium]|nr:class I SAM-dependent methyltransferase [Bacteriovoracaceae bacterium]